jgi:hypothetical protein
LSTNPRVQPARQGRANNAAGPCPTCGLRHGLQPQSPACPSVLPVDICIPDSGLRSSRPSRASVGIDAWKARSLQRNAEETETLHPPRRPVESTRRAPVPAGIPGFAAKIGTTGKPPPAGSPAKAVASAGKSPHSGPAMPGGHLRRPIGPTAANRISTSLPQAGACP